MNRFEDYEERRKVYLNALCRFGDRHQMDIAIEEMAECTQAICKIKRNGEDFRHLAEEVADVLICMEQLRMMFNIDELVQAFIYQKVDRLNRNLEKEAYDG